MTVNQQHLKQAWDTSKVSTSEDWQEWLRRMAVEFMRESPSHALRACRSPSRCLSCPGIRTFQCRLCVVLTELYEQYQSDLVKALETAFDAPEVPGDVVHMLLNLAEFMEHDDKALPINIRVLATAPTSSTATPRRFTTRKPSS